MKFAENKKRALSEKQAKLQQFWNEFQNLEKSMKSKVPEKITLEKPKVEESSHVEDCLAAVEVS